MKITIGEKIVPKLVSHTNDADNLWGPGWHAQRRDNGIVLRYQTAGHGTPDNELHISKDEFEELRANPDALEKVLRAHGE